jgi:hypothetical protein
MGSPQFGHAVSWAISGGGVKLPAERGAAEAAPGLRGPAGRRGRALTEPRRDAVTGGATGRPPKNLLNASSTFAREPS